MVLLSLLGIFVGFVGTALGLGGGLILTPFLLYLYPEMPPNQLTAISLFCIAINSTIGALSYFRKKRVHLRSALLFSVASLPGAWFGVQLASLVQRSKFELIFGIFLAIIGSYLIIRKPNKHIDSHISEWKGTRARFTAGFLISFFVGTIASFLGIGGGIIHVPLLVEVMQFPAHTAVATSHFILAASAIIASVEHYTNGTLVFNSLVLYIAAGIVIGSPLGAKASTKVKGANIMKLIGGVVILVGIRLLYTNLMR